ncbi:hypothetical protein [Marinicella meishanensis]|uniref:hypothetical protein n=1 Tax=Marinicella meishanensis TaxID=2873263 RepID=UPI001CBF5688|nr:hypothetical protein [Marinicella sp. NBU2979]
MNVFVLCTGRCGSTTFAKACQHIHNFTAAHESRTGLLGADRFAYPPNHIEVDNRLAWLLGRLDKKYGNDAFYVHLTRNEEDTCNSLVKRINQGIMRAYKTPGVLLKMDKTTDPQVIARDYCHTINENIRMFLKDKTKQMDFSLENWAQDFSQFCAAIDAEVNLQAALGEFNIKHNASL